MKRILCAAFAAVSVIFLPSCKEIIDFNGDYDGEKLVLFSCANPDASQFTVSLSKSRFFLDDSQDLHPYDLKGGSVTLTLDGKTVTLAEDPDKAGTFHTEIVPEVGARVVLEASAPGLAPVSCEAVVPERVRCDVVSVDTKVLGETEWGISVERHVMITIHDDVSRRDYYRFIAVRKPKVQDSSVEGNEGASYSKKEISSSVFLKTNDVAFMQSVTGSVVRDTARVIDGVYDDSFFNGMDYTFEAWFEDYVSKYREYFGGHSDEPVEYGINDFSGWGIEVDALSEDLYKYQRSRDDYRKSYEGLISFFTEPVSIHNNIKGGIGCFGAISPSLTMF